MNLFQKVFGTRSEHEVKIVLCRCGENRITPPGNAEINR